MTVPGDLLTLLGERYRFIKMLLEIDNGTTPVRICTGSDPVDHGGDTYTPRSWKPGTLRSGSTELASWSCTIADVDAELETQAYLEGFTGADLTFTVLAHDGDGVWKTAWVPLTGHIFSVEGGHARIDITVRGGIGLGSRAGLQEGDSRCRLVFKGTRCKYGGADLTCDRTYADCAARTGGDNTANFRGVRYAPEPGTVIPLGPSGATVPRTPPWVNTYGWRFRPRYEMMEDPTPPPIATDGAPPAGDGGHTPMENPNEPLISED